MSNTIAAALAEFPRPGLHFNREMPQLRSNVLAVRLALIERFIDSSLCDIAARSIVMEVGGLVGICLASRGLLTELRSSWVPPDLLRCALPKVS